MIKVDDTVTMKRGGMCSKHKGQIGTVIKISGPEIRPSYFVKFSDGVVEVHRKKSFEGY